MTPAVDIPKRAVPAQSRLWLFGFLVLLCYAPAIKSLVRDWMTNDDMGHGFFVPVVAGYIVWQKRDELAALPVKPNYWGLALVFFGAAQSIAATLGVELFLSRSAIIPTIAGVIWTLGGTAWLKRLAFPLLLLCFMVPLPALIYNSITFPLQILASQLADGALTLFDIPVLRQGNVLQLPSGPLSVVEACSGIRSLLSLTFLALVYGYFFESSRRIRIALLAATVPIAILANGGRVTLTGMLSMIRPELARGFFHESTGWVVFLLALGMLLVFQQLVRRTGRLFRSKASQ
jgi:exosortase